MYLTQLKTKHSSKVQQQFKATSETQNLARKKMYYPNYTQIKIFNFKTRNLKNTVFDINK